VEKVVLALLFVLKFDGRFHKFQMNQKIREKVEQKERKENSILLESKVTISRFSNGSVVKHILLEYKDTSSYIP
jgi:hypothetical protein